MKLTRPFQWRGGKALIAKELLPHFAKADHYVEPFFGGGGMFFAIPDNIYKVKTVNDINKNIVTFFRVLRTRTEELVRVCEYTPYARDELEACIPDSEDELEQARRVWVRGRQGWLGEAKSRGDWGTTRRVAFDTAGKTEAKLQALREYASRLRHTSIDNMDAFELIEQVASSNTFIYCMHPSTKVRLANTEEFVNISEVKVGDTIAPGREVKAKFSRQHIGDLFDIKIQGMPEHLKLTGEHKVLAIRGRDRTKKQEFRSNVELWNSRRLIPANELAVGDYVVVPTGGKEIPIEQWNWRTESNTNGRLRPSVFNPSKALYRLLGYYAAEGYVQWLNTAHGRRSVSVNWAFNIDEISTYVQDVVDICKATFGFPVVWARFRETGAVRMRCHSTALAEFFQCYIPGLALEKKLHPALMTAPIELQFELLKGWLRGDAGFDKATRNRCKLFGVTGSKTLAYQMYTIALRCGLKPSIKKRVNVYDVYFASEDAQKLGWDVSARKFRSMKRVVEGHMLAQIREIKKEHYEGEVIDIDVDGDDLFAAPWALIHNCDPPYICDTEMYENGFTEADHRRLAEVNKKATEAGATIAISGYPSPIYDELYKDWNRLEFQTHSTSRKKREKGDVEVIQAPRTEVLWMSYPESKKIGNPDKYLKPKPLSNLEKALLVGARS